jgi:uncharacterized membrane protein YkgB
MSIVEDVLSEPDRDHASTHSPIHQRVRAGLERGEAGIVRWLASHSIKFLRGGLGVVFLWFGALKLVPGLSPAQGLAVETIHILTGGLLPPAVSLGALAIVECTIGIGFLSGRFMRVTLLLMAFQMAGTFTPLIVLPGTVFAGAPYALTLEGQFIIKNLVLVGGGMVVAATLREGHIAAAPHANEDAEDPLTDQNN